MHKKTILAAGGAALALALASPAALAAQVSVRVEGKTHTLLAQKSIHTHAGSVTRGGAPPGGCPAKSAAGALDVATRHRFGAKWSSQFSELFISSILGDTESGTNFYWAIWINDRFATTGACEIKLHRGDQLLFAVDSFKHHEHPLAIRAPKHAVAGTPFTVKVVSFSDSGKSKPAAGVRLSGAGQGVVTNSHGVAQVMAARAGTLKLGASGKRFIRAAQARVRVTG